MAELLNNASPWQARIENANKVYEDWENKFKCKRLEEYYENFQWKGRVDNPQVGYNPYVLNLFHSTIKIKLANLLFQKPTFVLNPEPGHSHWDLDFAVQSAQLKQDVLNTIIKNRNLKFARHTKMAALDSFFRFGMIEVGYAADWRNPLKDEPQLSSWDNPDVAGTDKDRVVSDLDVPVNERFYIKRIKPSRFRVSASDAEDLEEHEWVGYFQYFYTDTLKKTKGIKFPKDYDGNYISSDFHERNVYSKNSSGLYVSESTRGICKVWHIWDLVSNTRKLILGDGEYTELWAQPFERLPLVDLRWDLRLSGYYPIPPTWYWLSPQDEINESREQVRSYRRRFTRKFQALKGMVDEEEVEKFVSGPDGVVVEVKQTDAITPIQNPELGATAENALIQAKDDFLVASGSSAESRPGGDRETATKSAIADQRAKIRESAEQMDFSEFVCTIGREILSQCAEKLVDGLWIKYSSNPSEGPLQDMQVNAPMVKWIQAQDISDGYDFNIEVDIQNATPAAMEQARQAYIDFITFLAANPMLAMSPALIRETAYRFGYKNEQVIHQLQQVAVLSMAAKASQAAEAQGSTLSNEMNKQQETQAQMSTPSPDVINQQITNQIQ